ncbi:MAG: peptidase associated/transthyretin-like domain-containing protein, partial [Thermoplasmatota archaeon]
PRNSTLAGRVEGAPDAAASTLTVELVSVLPCGVVAVAWHDWRLNVTHGAFGPLTIPEPRGNDTRLDLVTSVPGYNAARRSLGRADYEDASRMSNVTLAVEPAWTAEVGAWPLAVVAVARVGAPVAPTAWSVAPPNGTLAFETLTHAADYDFVAATPDGRLAARAVTGVHLKLVGGPDVDLAASHVANGSIRGHVTFGDSGASVGDDVPVFAYARSASGVLHLASAARTDKNGTFVLPIDAPGNYTLEARGQMLRSGMGYGAKNVSVEVASGTMNATRDLSLALSCAS